MAEQIDTEIIIVGGGIGGLSAALALSRIGKSVCVLEQAAEFSEIGAGIQLGPNVYKVFERLDITDEVNDRSCFPDTLVARDSMNGQTLMHLEAAKKFKELYGYTYGVIHRADLHTVLLEKCEAADNVDMHVNAKVSAFSQEQGRVIAETGSGLRIKGDALIGADGLRSTIRADIIGDGDPRVSGHIAYRAVLSADNMPEDLRWNSMTVWAGEKTHLVHYPLRRGELFNLVAVFHSDKFTEGWDAFGDPDELRASFADKCEEVRTLLDKIESWRMWVLCDRDPVRDWSKGRVTLLGDAAHPMLQYLAQGANMAMEDAVCLADMVVNENSDYEKAFQRYYEARYLRTTRVQMTARLFGEIMHASGAVRDFRNAELSSWPAEKHYAGMAWLYGFEPNWLDK